MLPKDTASGSARLTIRLRGLTLLCDGWDRVGWDALRHMRKLPCSGNYDVCMAARVGLALVRGHDRLENASAQKWDNCIHGGSEAHWDVKESHRVSEDGDIMSDSD